MKKLIISGSVALGIAAVALVAQQGHFVPGTPGPVNVVLSSGHTNGDVCNVPNEIDVVYSTHSVYVCGGTATGPYTWNKAE